VSKSESLHRTDSRPLRSCWTLLRVGQNFAWLSCKGPGGDSGAAPGGRHAKKQASHQHKFQRIGVVWVSTERLDVFENVHGSTGDPKHFNTVGPRRGMDRRNSLPDLLRISYGVSTALGLYSSHGFVGARHGRALTLKVTNNVLFLVYRPPAAPSTAMAVSPPVQARPAVQDCVGFARWMGNFRQPPVAPTSQDHRSRCRAPKTPCGPPSASLSGFLPEVRRPPCPKLGCDGTRLRAESAGSMWAIPKSPISARARGVLLFFFFFFFCLGARPQPPLSKSRVISANPAWSPIGPVRSFNWLSHSPIPFPPPSSIFPYLVFFPPSCLFFFSLLFSPFSFFFFFSLLNSVPSYFFLFLFPNLFLFPSPPHTNLPH